MQNETINQKLLDIKNILALSTHEYRRRNAFENSIFIYKYRTMSTNVKSFRTMWNDYTDQKQSIKDLKENGYVILFLYYNKLLCFANLYLYIFIHITEVHFGKKEKLN